MDTENKLRVLVKIARMFNQADITWAVGGSMLLYFHNITKEFHDIDIMVLDSDAEAVKALLLTLGTLEPPKASVKFKSKAFYEFTIDGVDVDVMAGFVIVQDGKEHDCSLQGNEITDFIQLQNERIPLHTIAAWRRNYIFMGKPDTVRLIDSITKKPKGCI